MAAGEQRFLKRLSEYECDYERPHRVQEEEDIMPIMTGSRFFAEAMRGPGVSQLFFVPTAMLPEAISRNPFPRHPELGRRQLTCRDDIPIAGGAVEMSR